MQEEGRKLLNGKGENWEQYKGGSPLLKMSRLLYCNIITQCKTMRKLLSCPVIDMSKHHCISRYIDIIRAVVMGDGVLCNCNCRFITIIQYGCMSSIHGSNIQFCCERFLQNQNELLGKMFDKRNVFGACLNRRDTESYCRAACVLELLMVKRDILYIPDNFLTNRPNINDMLYNLCTSWC